MYNFVSNILTKLLIILVFLFLVKNFSMDILNKNIKFLRKQKGYTQQQFADFLKIKRSALGAYEEGRAKPNLEVQKAIAKEFGISLDQLLTKNLSAYINQKLLEQGNLPKDLEGKNLRVLSITVDKANNENIELVSQKAAAGYLNGFADPEFIEELPRFRLPMLPPGTYRAFEISGDSMLPLQSGSIVLGEYVSDWTHIKDGLTYVIISKSEGVVYKRAFNQVVDTHKLVLRSDNPSYSPFEIDIDDVLEIWQSRLFISYATPEGNVNMEKMMGMLMELQQEVMRLKEK